MTALDIAEYTHTLGSQAKTASALMARAPAAIKNKALRALAQLLRDNVQPLQHDNARDLERAVAAGLDAPMVDRLKLTPKVIETCAQGCEQLAAMPDIIGEIQGMKQQLTLAIAYATGARYLLLDEPMNALDPSRVDLHSEILRKLADSGTCIIMSSHILDSVDRLCDEILFLKDGRLIRSIPQDDAAPKSPGSHFAKPAGRAEGALSTYRRLYEKGG